MAEGFLHRYNDELLALRRRAARFADAFPKIAGRLRMTGEAADDPHVERLIQSFAFSAARVRQKLDDELPELTNGLLETLYPHYLAPLPSMSIVRFEPTATLDSLQTIPRQTEIVAEPVGSESCRFRTTQDVTIAPIAITAVTLQGQPIQAPVLPTQSAAGCLRVSIRSRDPARPIAALGLTRLRFHLQAPWRQASALYERLLNHTIGIALANHADDPAPQLLAREALRPVGFEADEAMLPYPATSFSGYRLLTEFFALPQKFLFFDLDGLERWAGASLEIFFYLDEADSRLERAVGVGDLALHATPVVNLFTQRCEPVTVDGTRTEYRLLADSRRQRTREIYAVEQVRLIGRGGEEQICQPFFGRSAGDGPADAFWQISRRFDEEDATSDVDIAFISQAGHPAARLDAVASIDALCLNRDLPARLPFGGGHPLLRLAEPNEAIGGIEALLAPSAAVRMTDADGRHWRLMSHLMLNHLSLFDHGGGAIKSILSLYAFRDAPETRQLVDAIIRVEAQTATARLGGGGMVPGTEIVLEFDPAAIDQPSAFLFASVLDRFFGLYTSINSFTRLTASIKGQSRPIATWRARAAERPLL